MAPILTVSELNRRARQWIESGFPLLWVAGEISNLSRAPSGHVYFTLKDETAQVRCALFRTRAQLVPWRIENGQHVEVEALVTLYEARGEFQLTVESMRRAGLGRLYEAFLKLREKLAAEGLFDAQRKRPLPLYPRRLGVITSVSAAALRDVLAALRRRAPHLEVVLYPSLVQGTQAPASLTAALDSATRHAACDLLLIVRGGGSLEDLWAFNDETFVRALAASPIPTLVGVGHETDLTLADLAADQRAATPTAAAELATSGWFAARQALVQHAVSLYRAMTRRLREDAQTLDRLAQRLIDPRRRLLERRQRLALLTHRLTHAGQAMLAHAQAELVRRRWALSRLQPSLAAEKRRLERLAPELRNALRRAIEVRREQIALAQRSLLALSPVAVLARGYSIVRKGTGAIVSRSRDLHPGETIHITFAEGEAEAKITSRRL